MRPAVGSTESHGQREQGDGAGGGPAGPGQLLGGHLGSLRS